MTNVEVSIQPTPNPNALKFTLNSDVKSTEGASSYQTPMQAMHNPLACALFTIRGVDQVHFNKNSVTITKFGYEDWDAIEDLIVDCLRDRVPAHDPEYNDPDPEAERRRNLSPELQEIEKIIDKTIRTGLQADGGDLICLSYTDNILIIKYQGACGSCPSSTTGTLEAIKHILRENFNPEIDVYIAPEY